MQPDDCYSRMVVIELYQEETEMIPINISKTFALMVTVALSDRYCTLYEVRGRSPRA